jgi:arsenate reductase
MTQTLLPKLTQTVNQLVSEFNYIPNERKDLLSQLAEFVRSKINSKQTAYLNFICTHNSRRSHLSQIWAQAAAHYYKVNDVACFSGGTEATAFNPRAVKAMQDAGFSITEAKAGNNPIYEVRFSGDATPVIAFSKKYDDPFNPKRRFRGYYDMLTCRSELSARFGCLYSYRPDVR